MSQNYPLVSIVTVEYKNDPQLSHLLSSLDKLDYPKSSLEIIIVEILSSIRKIRIGIPMKHISFNRKMGYAEAVNVGISQSRGKYIFTPNPDIIVEKKALTELIYFIQKHKRVGITGPKVFLKDNPTKISIYDLPCKNFHKLSGKVESATLSEVAKINKPTEFYWVCGNGVVFKKTLWEEVKKYDESYFLYWEDADFGMKIRDLGYKSILVPAAKLFHKGSSSVGNSADQVYYGVRNGRFFINKYSGISGKVLVYISNILLIISKMVKIIFRIPDHAKNQAFLDGLIDFCKGKRGMR